MSSLDLKMSKSSGKTDDSENPEEGNILEVLDTRLIKKYKHPRIVNEGYMYFFHEKCNNHIRWICNTVYSTKCPAVLLTTLDMEKPQLIKIDNEHQHGVDDCAINDLKLKITAHRASSKFQNNTMFKSKNGYIEIKLYEVDKSVNNKMLKPKNDYADINIDEEDKPNKLDPVYKHRYTDEQIIKNKNINDISIDFECPKIRITRNTNKQKKIDMNNVKNNITDNSTNKDIGKNALNTNTDEKINNKIINTSDEKKSLISSIKKNNNTLTSNTHEEIIPLRSNILTRKRKHSLISNINKDKNTLTRSTHKEIFPLTTNTHTNKEKNALTNNIIINKNENTMTSHTNNDKNTLNSNTDKKINMVITNIRTLKRDILLSGYINEDENTFTGNLSKNNNVLTGNNYIKKKNTITSNSPTILTSKINIIPSIKSCVDEFIGFEYGTRNIDNNSGQNHTDHRDGEPYYVTNDVNLVEDNISIYCEKNWPTILHELSDPVKGIRVLERILFNKACEQMLRQPSIYIKEIESHKKQIKRWKSKYECLAYEMKKFRESTK